MNRHKCKHCGECLGSTLYGSFFPFAEVASQTINRALPEDKQVVPDVNIFWGSRDESNMYAGADDNLNRRAASWTCRSPPLRLQVPEKRIAPDGAAGREPGGGEAPWGVEA
eukprot:5389063-Prymnesium_polylepis.1